jgi:hypothetical protein
VAEGQDSAVNLTWTDPSGVEHEVTPAQRFRLEVTQDGTAECYLCSIVERIVRNRPNGHGLIRCDGLIRACHIIPKQRIRRRFPASRYYRDKLGGVWQPLNNDLMLKDWRAIPEACSFEVREQVEIVYDPRNGFPGCDKHHHLLDQRAIKLDKLDLPRLSLPDSALTFAPVEQFAIEYGLKFELDRLYGERVAA